MEKIRKAFTHDHQRLQAHLDDLVGRISDGDFGNAEVALTAFARRLRAHLRIEEEVLFPPVEHIVKSPALLATAALRREHDLFRGLLAEVEASSSSAALGNLRELQAALRLHVEKEEKLLYPTVDRLLSSTSILELAALLEEEERSPQ